MPPPMRVDAKLISTLVLGRTDSSSAHACSCRSYFYLVWNIFLNNVEDRVIPYHLGLSAQGGQRSFLVSTLDSTGNRMSKSVGGASNGGVWDSLPPQEVTVNTFRLESFLLACNVDRVAFIKLDCEGCEYEVVPPNEQFFTQRVQHVSGELHQTASGAELERAKRITRRIMCQDRPRLVGRGKDAFYGC